MTGKVGAAAQECVNHGAIHGAETLVWGPRCCRFRLLKFKDLISLLSLFWHASKAKPSRANAAQSSKVSGTVVVRVCCRLTAVIRGEMRLHTKL